MEAGSAATRRVAARAGAQWARHAPRERRARQPGQAHCDHAEAPGSSPPRGPGHRGARGVRSPSATAAVPATRPPKEPGRGAIRAPGQEDPRHRHRRRPKRRPRPACVAQGAEVDPMEPRSATRTAAGGRVPRQAGRSGAPPWRRSEGRGQAPRSAPAWAAGTAAPTRATRSAAHPARRAAKGPEPATGQPAPATEPAGRPRRADPLCGRRDSRHRHGRVQPESCGAQG